MDKLLIVGIESLNGASTLTADAITGGFNGNLHLAAEQINGGLYYKAKKLNPDLWSTFDKKASEGLASMDTAHSEARISGSMDAAEVLSPNRNNGMFNAILSAALKRRMKVCLVAPHTPHALMPEYTSGFNKAADSNVIALGYLTRKGANGKPIGFTAAGAIKFAQAHYDLREQNTRTMYVDDAWAALADGRNDFLDLADLAVLDGLYAQRQPVSYLNTYCESYPRNWVARKVLPGGGFDPVIRARNSSIVANHLLDLL